jgi:transcriptional regulator with XRE-family HTH domain
VDKKTAVLIAMRDLLRLPRSYLSLYWLIRKERGWTQQQCSEEVNISRSIWARRERCRTHIRAVELLALKEGFGLSWDEMGRFIEQAASADIIIVQNMPR